MKYTIGASGKISNVETTQIGIITFVTAETFNGSAVQIYPYFDLENEITGTMLIYGAAVGSKLIYRIPNPSEETPFQNYYLTKVRQTNFRSGMVG